MKMFLLFFIFILPEMNCKVLPNPFFNLPFGDQCALLCLELYSPKLWPSFHHDYKAATICHVGCLLFHIQDGGGLDVNPAIHNCETGCKKRFFRQHEADTCTKGCWQVASKYQNAIQKELIMTPQQRYGINHIYRDPDLDAMDLETNMDLLFDPSMKRQLDVGYDMNYKIPETHIRTMPIEDKKEPIKVVQNKPKDNGDWLDCASKNSGIPKWILLSTIMGAIIVALWLTLAMESRKGHGEYDDELAEISEQKDKESLMVEKDEIEAVNIHVEFSPPPKYSEVTRLDQCKPPNYDEVVENRNREEIV